MKVIREGEADNTDDARRCWHLKNGKVFALRSDSRELYVDGSGWVQCAKPGQKGNTDPFSAEWHLESRAVPARILLDNSHEYWFTNPYMKLLKADTRFEVCTTQIGLRPSYLKAFDAIVIYGGRVPLLESETEAVINFVQQGGGVLLSGKGSTTDGLEDKLKACSGGPFSGPVESLASYSEKESPEQLKDLFTRLVSKRSKCIF